MKELTVENKDLPSAKSSLFESRFSVKSFFYKRKNRGPRMDPWGTPALISVHDEYCPFKTTLCFLLIKKSVKKYIS